MDTIQYWYELVTHSIVGLVFIALVIRNCFGSKFRIIYCIGVIFIVNVTFTVLSDIDEMCNYGYGYLLDGFSSFLYYLVHWIFTWRYWCVSESLADVRSRPFCSLFMRYVFFFTITALILAVEIASTVSDGKSGQHFSAYYVWVPLANILFDAIILLIAVIRVWKVLREEAMGFINEKYMAFHAALMFLLAAATAINYFLLNSIPDDKLAGNTVTLCF